MDLGSLADMLLSEEDIHLPQGSGILWAGPNTGHTGNTLLFYGLAGGIHGNGAHGADCHTGAAGHAVHVGNGLKGNPFEILVSGLPGRVTASGCPCSMAAILSKTCSVKALKAA